MPIRPKEHALEDLSRTKFQLVLPEVWVYRDKDKDYGIDGEVEIFNEDGRSTGLMFYVQLKGTASKKDSQIHNVDLKIETLNYFRQLDIPVLLVRYSKHLDEFFFKWVNNEDLTLKKENAKTFRIKIPEQNRWIEQTNEDIKNELLILRTLINGAFKFPITYSLQVKDDITNGLSANILKVKLRNQLNNFSDFIEYGTQKESFLVEALIENNSLQIRMSILNGVYLHNLDSCPQEIFIDIISKDFMLAIGMCMVFIGKVDYCGKIIFANNLGERLMEKPELFLPMLPALLNSSYFENTLDLILEAFNPAENKIVLFPAITSILLQTDTKEKKKIKLIESFFHSLLEKSIKTGLTTLVANSHYNLGNFYRARGNNYKSIKHYSQTKKNDPSYLKREYFYREVAGVCFESNKFYFSSLFYKKAIEIGAKGNIKSLYADALLFSGNYEKASKMFNAYLEEVEEPAAEFILKAVLLQTTILPKATYQKRISREATGLEGVGSFESRDLALAQIDKIFDMDLLASSAWFNLGILENEEKKFQEACYCFSMCAVINLVDIEAWLNAFLTFLNSGKKIDLLLGSLILQTAYYHNGDEFLVSLYEVLENTEDSPNTEIVELIDKMMMELPGKDNFATLRLVGKDEYKEITIK